MPGAISFDLPEPAAARKRIAELEAELAIHRRAAERLGKVTSPRCFEAIRVMAVNTSRFGWPAGR